jgi:conserved hypothetical protein YidD
MKNYPQRLVLAAIGFYRRRLSPLKRMPTCKYYPTCSQYAAEAVSEWGVFVGGALSLWRLLRCNQFSRGGIDYVPRRRKPDESAAFAGIIRIYYF